MEDITSTVCVPRVIKDGSRSIENCCFRGERELKPSLSVEMSVWRAESWVEKREFYEWKGIKTEKSVDLK
jgi:predicted transcriptional regulator